MSALPTDADIYCLSCGYNLRGLTGDPRRCPECFYSNPLGDAQIPAAMITKQLQAMETVPCNCVVASLVILIFSGGAVVALFSGGLAEMTVCCTVVLLLAGLGWIAGLGKFRSFCLKQAGWIGALLKYHLYGVGLAVLVVGSVLYGLWGAEQVCSASGPLWRRLASSLPAALLAACLPFVSRWGYRKAIEDLRPLQRDVAVHIARQRLRKKLAHSAGRPQ